MRFSQRMTTRWLRPEDAGGAGILGFCLLLLVCMQPAQAQRSSGPAGDPLTAGGQFSPSPLNQPPMAVPGPLERKMRVKQLDALNTQRQKSLVSDTDRLVELATKLNAQINNSHQPRLTPDQLRTVAEIERLAKRVREKMSNAVSGAPSVIPQPPIIMPPIPNIP